MVYLSNQILFIILVVVLFVGGTSELIIEGVENINIQDRGANKGTGCKSGCVAASQTSGNCKWLPANVPKHLQRYICPHTCKRPSGASGSGYCENDTECTACTPQKDFTASAYAKMQVSKGTGNACKKGDQCTFSQNGGLYVCNSVGVSSNDNSDSNGVNNLICVKNAVSGNSAWTGIDAAVLAIPYTPSQTSLLSCDVKQACSTEGDSCVDATGGRIFCHNNLWLNDPKYNKNPAAETNNDRDNDNDNDNDDGGGSSRNGGKGVIKDNYYTVNHFYGPSKRGGGILKPVASAINKVANTAGVVVGGVAGGISGAYDNIKSAFAPPLPKQMNYGAGKTGSGVVVGSTVVPLIVPKGEVATVQSYEASIRF